MSGWLLLGAAVILLAILGALRRWAGLSASAIAPWISFTGQAPDYLNTMYVAEEEAKDRRSDDPRADPAP
jgi:hypothetical protein